MDETAPLGERPGIWYVYVIGICLLAIAAVFPLNDRFPGNPKAAAVVLVALLTCALRFTRPQSGMGELSVRTVASVVVVVALCVLAIWLAPSAVVAVLALYPVVFSLLPLATALPVVTAVNFAPLMIELIAPRFFNLPLVVVTTLVATIASAITGTTFAVIVRQRTELARLSREAGIAGERERLAREIHDTLAQGFTSIIALVQAIDVELDAYPMAARRHLALIRTSAQENLTEARAMVEGLTPNALGDDVLVGALHRVCDQFATETAISTDVGIDPGMSALGTAIDVALLRVTQEALANVRKHSHATTVRIELAATPTHTQLLIADNGIGFPSGHTDGFGLRGMRSRVTQLGGDLIISTKPGRGTSLRAKIPR